MLCCALTQAAEFLDEENGFPHLFVFWEIVVITDLSWDDNNPPPRNSLLYTLCPH